MNGIERLRELLTAAGRTLTRDAMLYPGSAASVGHEAMHEVLLAFGVVTPVEANDAFNVDGSHSAVLIAAARCAGLDNVTATDRWSPHVGRLMTVETGKGTVHFLKRFEPSADGDEDEMESEGEAPPNHWMNHELLFDALQSIAEPHGLSVISVGGFDERMSVGFLPRSVLTALEAEQMFVGIDALLEWPSDRREPRRHQRRRRGAVDGRHPRCGDDGDFGGARCFPSVSASASARSRSHPSPPAFWRNTAFPLLGVRFREVAGQQGRMGSDV